MNTFLTGFSSVLSSLGANGILPIMLFLVAIIFRMKIGEAIRAALTGAVGMVGMNLVTNMLVAQMTPATQGMVERLGWHLDIVDTGWSLISYSWGSPVAGILILIGIGLNLVLLITNFTKTLMIDFWNYWSFLACGALIYGATESIMWSCIATAIYMAITWKWSDIVAPRFQEESGMEGCTWPTGAIIAPLMIGLPVIKLCQHTPGIRSIHLDPETMQNKLGVFGETMVVGAIIGAVIGVLAGFGPVQIWLLAVNMGAVMVLLPRMIGIMMEGLLPIAGAAQEFCEKRLKGKKIWIGIDASTLMGNACNMTSIMIMTPIVTIMSIIPGNRMLAVASLVAVPWFIIPLAYYAKDNILHTCIAAFVVFCVYFWCATALAGAHTNLAFLEGVVKNTHVLTSCLSEGGNPLTWIMYKILQIFGMTVV
jgi:Phosphotransferase system, galactitol-specific IIC component